MQQNEVVLIVTILATTVVNIFFCFTLTHILSQIKYRNRQLSPILIWLLLIPLLGLIAMFFVVKYISSSIESELHDRNYEVTEKPALASGLGLASISVILIFNMPLFLTGVLSTAAIVLYIQYWYKINWYKKLLKQDSASTDN